MTEPADPSSGPPRAEPAALALVLHPGLRGLAQVAGLAALWWASDGAMRALRLPVPGSVAGLAVLVLLLRKGWLPLSWVAEGAGWLLAEMLLFFIPAVVAVVQYPAVILKEGWQLLLVILLGTVGVMVGTALVVERAVRLEQRLRRREGP
ncbi:hypothetical protein GETHPA_22450 [Geothrix rubra]|uniref:CidA/LrgA family protein n=1 Tax=Geothrix rubra TaxID=2927977 RepID=A0ABQ5Q804_9BACT|nr:CidA/LrgA family protein [Geothrix rubra]GLH70712.1 hypothetical protein GETHPA_22450 [Geothrix rubra]